MNRVINVRNRKILYVHSSDEIYGADQMLFYLVARLDRSYDTPSVVLPSDVHYQGMLTGALRE